MVQHGVPPFYNRVDMNSSKQISPAEKAWRRLALYHVPLTVTLQVVMTFTSSPIVRWPVLAVVVGQIALLAVWFTFGDGGTAFRLFVYLMLSLVAALLGFSAFGFSLDLFVIPLVLSFGILFLTWGPLSMSWSRGWRLAADTPSDREGAPWEISTRLLLALTLLVALLMTLHGLVTSMGVPEEDGSYGFPDSGYLFLLGPVLWVVTPLGFSLCVTSAVWSCLATRGFLSHLCATSLIVALFAGIPLTLRLGSTAHLQWASRLAVMMLTVILSLLFLRMRGVRAIHVPTRFAPP